MTWTNKKSSEYYDKFTYYDRYKRISIYVIIMILFFIIFANVITKNNIRIKPKFLEETVYIGVTLIGFLIGYIITKRTCYHEGSFYFKNDDVIISLEKRKHIISKSSVKKVKFISRKSYRSFQGYYYLIVHYGNEVCKIRLSRDMYYNKKDEEINIYKIYKFLKKK